MIRELLYTVVDDADGTWLGETTDIEEARDGAWSYEHRTGRPAWILVEELVTW